MAESVVDKKKYKLLKQALREEREHRNIIEYDLQKKITKVEEQSIELDGLKERIIELH